MTTINEAFDLRRPEDIRAMGFVVRLRESDPGLDKVKKLVDDYVITPAVEKELPRILDGMKQAFDRGEEYVRSIHGSFGSGKSHFMTMLSLLLEGARRAWKKSRPLFNAHLDARQRQVLVSLEGPSHELIEDWKKRVPPPSSRGAKATRAYAKGGARGRDASDSAESEQS